MLKKYFFFIAVLAVGFFSETALCRVTKYENQKIDQVIIKGNKIINDAAIKNKLKTKKGTKLKRSIVIEDVKNLFDIGYFSNIFVKSRKNKKRRLIVTFNVEEKARIDSVSYKGNHAMSKKKLKELSQLKAYEFLDIKKLKNAIASIQKGYEDKGYFLAKISYNLEKQKDPKKVKLIIQINEEQKTSIKKINFIGNKNIPDDKIKMYLLNKEQSILSFFTGSGIYKEENLKKDVQIIRQIYFERGYVEVKIDEPEVHLSPNKDGLYISYSISEGDVFSVGQIDFSGDLIFSKVELRKDLPLETEDTLVYSRLQQSLKKIQTKYGNKGYAFANVIPRFAGSGNTVHIMFDIQKGDLVHIDRINIYGNSFTRDKVIRRMVDVSEGDLYNSSKILNSKNSIQRLGYFDVVGIFDKTLENEDKKIDLEITVKEKEAFGVLQGGAGYNQSSLFLSFDLNKQNLFGLGLATGIQIKYFLGREFLLNANYVDSYFLDSDWYFGVSLFASKKINVKKDFFFHVLNCFFTNWLCMGNKKMDPFPKNASKEDTSEPKEKIPWEYYNRQFLKDRIGMQLDFGRWLTDTVKFVPQFGVENVSFEHVSDPNIFDVDQAEGLRINLGSMLEYDSRDDRFFPKKGVFSNFSVEWTQQFPNEELVSTKKFVQFDYIFRIYKQLIWNIVWKNNIQYGLIYSITGDSVPFDKLYLLGGPENLRGFDFFSVGKRIQGQENRWIPYGGTQQLFYNMEFQFPLIKEARLYGLAFFDIGYADNKISLNKLKKDVGVGILLITPLAPLVLRWAFPFKPDKELGEMSSQLHISAGSEF